MDIKDLIEEITPLQRLYKNALRNEIPVLALEYMWEIGEELRSYISSNSINPHQLYRKVYGKGEGLNNILQKSYISREFQSRCYRVRKLFNQKQDIITEFKNLNSIEAFNKAMPFLDNPKYLFKEKERTELVKLLNSNLSKTIVLHEIQKLRKDKIGIKNPRNQRHGELLNEEIIFISFYNYIYRLLKDNDFEDLKDMIDTKFYIVLSKNISALSQDGLQTYSFNIPQNITVEEKDFGILIKGFMKDKTPKRIRRFRKLISIGRMIRLADMLFALSSEISFNTFRRNNFKM